MATYKGIAVVKDLAAGATVRTDRAMLQQVVGNLLSNAIRYTVRGSITVRSRLEPGGVRVEVEDTGIGMTPEDQARIFEEFFQVDGTHRAVGEGYGLGLAVAKRMAGLMGGDLSVASEPGKGSTFTLTLPSRLAVRRPRRRAAGTESLEPTGRSAPCPAGGKFEELRRVWIVHPPMHDLGRSRRESWRHGRASRVRESHDHPGIPRDEELRS